MSLLELQHLSKRYRHGAYERNALRDVSLQLDAGELVAVWGLRRSGRSTLLRLAAGIEAPDSGVVRFAGHELATDAGAALADGIAYCHPPLRCVDSSTVLEEIIAGPLARGETPSQARALAEAALERTGARHCAKLAPRELDSAETVRVAIAQGLAKAPSLLLIDEPTKGVDLLDRDAILRLLRSLAREGIAILTTVGESTGLFGADRALSLNNGKMHGDVSPELAPVVRIPRRAIA